MPTSLRLRIVWGALCALLALAGATLPHASYGQGELITFAPSGVAPGRTRQSAPALCSLPFFDDFSQGSLKPHGEYWQEGSNVLLSTGLAIAPPTPGVAVFDALDAQGHLQAGVGRTSKVCDSLTSRPIDMPNLGSIYLTFRFQPQGWGGMPSVSDSLMVDFYDPQAKKWHPVWQASFNVKKKTVEQHDLQGTAPGPKTEEYERPNTVFFLATIPIQDARYLRPGFQFRFRNKASILTDTQMPGRNSNSAHWAVDMVYLDKGRAPEELAYVPDVALTSLPKAFELPYAQLPYQLAQSWLNDLASRTEKSISCTYRNFWHDSYNVERNFSIADSARATPTFSGSRGNEMVAAGENVECGRTYSFDWASLANRPLSVELKAYLRMSSSAGLKPFRWNDTMVRHVRFNDLYAYDQGHADNGYGLIGQGTTKASVAMMFAPIAPGTIQSVKVYFNPIADPSTRKRVRLCFWTCQHGQPSALLYDFMVTPPTTSGEQGRFVTYALPKPLGFSDTLFIGWTQASADLLNVAIDLSTDTPTPLFYNIAGLWYPSAYRGALLIRAVCTPGGETPRPRRTPVEQTRVLYSVFPNPAGDFCRIDGVQEPTRVTIYGARGERLRQLLLEPNAPIPLVGLPKGLLLLQFSSLEGQVLANVPCLHQ